MELFKRKISEDSEENQIAKPSKKAKSKQPFSFNSLFKGKAKADKTVIGGVAVSNLLPKSVIADRETKAAKGNAGRLIVGALLMSIVAAGGMFAYHELRNQELQAVYTDIQNLTIKQAAYKDVVAMMNQTTVLESLRKSVTTTEIDWGSLISELTTALPPGTSLDSISLLTAKTGSKAQVNPNSDLTFSIELTTDDLSKIEKFKLNIEKINGYKDSVFPDTSAGGMGVGINKTDGQTYRITGNLIFTKDLLWNRFAGEEKK